MHVASYRPFSATHICRCRVHNGSASAYGLASPPVGSQAPVIDTSRLGSHSQASSSVGSKISCSRQSNRIQTECALQSVPFRPSKLTVQRFPGTVQSGLCPQHPRRYTLTHNDLTGQLLLTIGHQYNREQLSGWYNRLLRDEILAYWQFGTDEPILHIECHVSGQETWLAPPILRDYIFRREMPLVLNIINFAESALFADNPAMADAQVMVHLASHVQAYQATVLWGSLSDCKSWQPPPRWARARLVTSHDLAAVPSLATSSNAKQMLSDSAQQSLARTASAFDDSLQDKPCVLPATDQEPSMHASSADRLGSVCQQQAEAQSCSSPEPEGRDAASTSRFPSESSMPRPRKARHNAACYRLHVACTAASGALPGHVQSQINSGYQHNLLSHYGKLSGLAYHVPPRL